MNEWINCDDRMPEDMVVVLALAKGAGVADLYTYGGEWFNVPFWWSKGIQYWMPMPGAPDKPEEAHFHFVESDSGATKNFEFKNMTNAVSLCECVLVNGERVCRAKTTAGPQMCPYGIPSPF